MSVQVDDSSVAALAPGAARSTAPLRRPKIRAARISGSPGVEAATARHAGKGSQLTFQPPGAARLSKSAYLTKDQVSLF